MPKLLASLREARSRITRALVCVEAANKEEMTYNMPLVALKECLDQASVWVEEAIEQEEMNDAEAS